MQLTVWARNFLLLKNNRLYPSKITKNAIKYNHGKVITLKNVYNEENRRTVSMLCNSWNETQGKLSKNVTYAIKKHCMGNKLTVGARNFLADVFLPLKSNIVICPKQQ